MQPLAVYLSQRSQVECRKCQVSAARCPASDMVVVFGAKARQYFNRTYKRDKINSDKSQCICHPLPQFPLWKSIGRQIMLAEISTLLQQLPGRDQIPYTLLVQKPLQRTKFRLQVINNNELPEALGGSFMNRLPRAGCQREYNQQKHRKNSDIRRQCSSLL